MDAEQNKKTIRRFVEELWNRRDVTAIDRYVADDLVGLAHMRSGIEAVLDESRETELTLNNILAEGDLVAAEWRLRIVTAEGNPVEMCGIDMYRLADDKVTWTIGYTNSLQVLQSMGAVPPDHEISGR